MEPVYAMLDALTDDPTGSALLLDYDGSLAPIVLMPQDAVPLPGTAAVLDEIAQHLGVVAIVSGRPVDFLLEHFPAPHVQLHGQYGLETARDGRVVTDERALAFVEPIDRAAAEVARRWPQIYIERKGTVALGLHWRNAPDVDPTTVRDLESLGERLGLSVHAGKMSREFRPPVDVDKGTVVRSLIDGMHTAAFAGDDNGDLPAFAALDAARVEGSVARTFRIGVSSSEAPAEVLANADVVVDGPHGLRNVLDVLLERL